MKWIPTLLVMLIVSCAEDSGDGECAQSSDCPEAQVCLFDLTRDNNYCTIDCARDSDCPDDQVCKTGVVAEVSGAQETSYCVDKIRQCQETEECNGLDDDCNGLVDDNCDDITQCLDDTRCGAWVCSPKENAATARCAEANKNAHVADYSRCTSDDQCRNGVCEVGHCAPLCRPLANCPSGMVCTEAVGKPNRPKHNMCQDTCATSSDCTSPAECVWRQTYQGAPAHYFVCSLVDAEHKALGASCPNNNPDGGDAECAHGLCYGYVCTRACGGPGANCDDVGPGFVCRETTLRYGLAEFGAFLCVEP